MNVIKAREHLFVHRHRITGGFDDEDDALVVDRQRVASIGIGLDHVTAVRDENSGNTWIAHLAAERAGAVLINNARDRRSIRGKQPAAGNGGRDWGPRSVFPDI